VRAFVTGVSGFVGGHLCEHLVAAGDLVVGISASGRWPAVLAHLNRSVRIESCDLADIDESHLSELLNRKQPEVIYHLAAQSNPHASLSDPRGTWALNLGGTLNLLEAVKAAALEPRPRVILVSSGVCYGNPAPEHLPVKEDCPLRPNNPYAASKAAADLLGIQHHLAHGTDVVMVRPFKRSRLGVKPMSRLAISRSFVTSPMFATWSAATASSPSTENQARSITLDLVEERNSQTPWTTSSPCPANRSRSGSTRRGCAPSISRSWLPMRVSFVLQLVGNRFTAWSKLWSICLTTAVADSLLHDEC